MNQELEIEYKNLLSKEEYTTLLNHFTFSKDDFFVQENYYFDTEDFQLKRHHAALRIRLKEQAAELTLKTPQSGHLLVTNQKMSSDEANELIKKKMFHMNDTLKTVLQDFGVDVTKPVLLCVHSTTKRAEKQTGRELVVLDQSWYNGKMDYELEIESDDTASGKSFFLRLLHQFNIPKRPTPNKIQRAFQTLFHDQEE